MNFSKYATKGLIAGLFTLLPFTAQAGLIVTIDDLNSGSQTAIDNAAFDLNPIAGEVVNIFGNENGSIGVLANSNAPDGWFLNDTTLTFQINAGAEFEVTVSDDSYALDAAAFATFITTTNASNLFGTGVDVELVSSVDGQIVFDGLITDNNSHIGTELVSLVSNPFTVEHVYTITNTSGSAQQFSIDTTTKVPEPTSLVLFSLALMGMALIRRKYYAEQ